MVYIGIDCNTTSACMVCLDKNGQIHRYEEFCMFEDGDKIQKVYKIFSMINDVCNLYFSEGSVAYVEEPIFINNAKPQGILHELLMLYNWL